MSSQHIYTHLQRLFALIGVILLVLVFSGRLQFTSDDSADVRTIALREYSNERLDLTISAPADWILQEPAEEDLLQQITFTKPAGSEWTSQLVIEVFETEDESLEVSEEEFFANVDQNISQSLDQQSPVSNDQEFSETLSEDQLAIGDKQARVVEVRINNYDETDGATGNGAVAFLYVSSNKQVSILYEAHDSEVNVLEALEKSLQSLRVN